jgi:hypothetical protein
MKYALSRIVSSERSPDVAGCGCGDAEICAVLPTILSLASVALRGFLVVVARRPLCGLAVFLVGGGTPDFADA